MLEGKTTVLEPVHSDWDVSDGMCMAAKFVVLNVQPACAAIPQGSKTCLTMVYFD